MASMMNGIITTILVATSVLDMGMGRAMGMGMEEGGMGIFELGVNMNLVHEFFWGL